MTIQRKTEVHGSARVREMVLRLRLNEARSKTRCMNGITFAWAFSYFLIDILGAF